MDIGRAPGASDLRRQSWMNQIDKLQPSLARVDDAAIMPAGKLQMHILGAIVEFERERIRERVMAGLQRARTQGKRLWRPMASIPVNRIHSVSNLPVNAAAERLGVSRSTLKRWRRQTAVLLPCQ